MENDGCNGAAKRPEERDPVIDTRIEPPMKRPPYSVIRSKAVPRLTAAEWVAAFGEGRCAT